MLTKLGHQVDVAKHGREAIDMLGKAGYDPSSWTVKCRKWMDSKPPE